MQIYKASDFGVEHGMFCEKQLEQFLKSIPHDDEEKVIEFAEGDYLIDTANLKRRMLYITNTAGDNEYKSGETPHEGCSPLCFIGLKNTTVEGNGARFVLHGKATNAVVSDCDNLKIKDIEITHVNPHMHELKVVGKGAFYVDYEIDGQSEYEVTDGNLYFVGKDYRYSANERVRFLWHNAYIPADNLNYVERHRHPLSGSIRIKELSQHRVRAYYPLTFRFKKGDRYYIFDRRRQYAGIFIDKSRDIALEGVKQRFNYSLALVAQNTENITVDSVEFAPEKDSGRLMSSVADFIQICMCRGKVNITNSYFDGAGDDCLNVHGFHFKIVSKNGNKITVRFIHPQSHGFNALRAGDKIAYIDTATLLEKGGAKIVNSELVTETDIELMLDDASGATVGDVIEDIDACPEVYFGGNTYTRIITRGLLLTTRGKTVIENNHFISNTMSGILLSDDAKSWYESGMCRDVTIRNNQFDYCGGNGVLILPENSRHAGAVHKNITIEGNTFKECKNDGIHIKSSSDIKIIGNKFGKMPSKLKTVNAENITKDF